MPLDKLTKAQQLLKALEGYGALSQEQLTAFVQEIANVFAQYRSASQAINKDTKDTLNLIVKQVNQEHDRILKEVKDENDTTTQNLTKELKLALDKVNSLYIDIQSTKPKDGEDGKDADENIIIEKVLALLPPKESETGESIVDKINALNTEPENQIDAKHIKNLPKFIDRVIGGGVRLLSNLLDVSITDPQNGEVLTYDSTLGRWKNASAGAGSMATHYAETPNEAIDGVRVAFTVDHSITFVMGIYLNGTFIHPDQYSYTGTTITFNSAIPEEFATSSFSIVYY